MGLMKMLIFILKWKWHFKLFKLISKWILIAVLIIVEMVYEYNCKNPTWNGRTYKFKVLII